MYRPTSVDRWSHGVRARSSSTVVVLDDPGAMASPDGDGYLSLRRDGSCCSSAVEVNGCRCWYLHRIRATNRSSSLEAVRYYEPRPRITVATRAGRSGDRETYNLRLVSIPDLPTQAAAMERRAHAVVRYIEADLAEIQTAHRSQRLDMLSAIDAIPSSIAATANTARVAAEAAGAERRTTLWHLRGMPFMGRRMCFLGSRHVITR